MSHLKKIALKMGVLGLVLWGGHSWVNQTPERAEATAITTDSLVETTLDKTDLALEASGQWADEKTTFVADIWDRIDISGKVGDVQDSVRPIGTFIKQRAKPSDIPGMKAASWADRNTSFPAMVLLLVAGVTLTLMAKASPSSLSSGRS